MSHQVSVVILMTEPEAREHIKAINASAADIGRRLLDIQSREGWKVLGYKNWTAFLEGEFSYSRQHLYELMTAAPILESLSATDYKLSAKAAVALSKFDADLRPVILRTATARYGELTESNVARVGNVVQEMATTGHVDTANGVSTPIDAALEAEDIEALKRQQQHIQERSEWEYKGFAEMPAQLQLAIEKAAAVLIDVDQGEMIKVVYYVRK
jgi:hypothetical protein